MKRQLPNSILLPEPNLSFHPDRHEESDIHPLRGLVRFGPYSKSMALLDPIRVATIAPDGQSNRLFSFLRELKMVHKPRERKEYLPDWIGFSEVFGVNVAPASTDCLVELPKDLSDNLKNSENSHLILADAILGEVRQLTKSRNAFDVAFILLPEAWSNSFYGDDDFNLHDYLKAHCATIGLPFQIVQESSALSYHCRASVMWRIGLALYVKAGGIPWKIADTLPDAAYIGISYALRKNVNGETDFVTCCSQVFDADGSGLEFVAYDASEYHGRWDNPFLSRRDMFRVINRSMDLYRKRHAGQVPKRVFIHKSTEFKRDEIQGCFDALPSCEEVDLVQVVERTSWKAAKFVHHPRGWEPEGYPIDRGLVIPTNANEALLWVHGSLNLNQRTYFQGGKGTPKPIKLVRHAGHGSWDSTVNSTLALSKMNWNNDGIYDHLPVTLGYAKTLAQVLKRMPTLGSQPYNFRYFM